jgi:hypothetical protein
MHKQKLTLEIHAGHATVSDEHGVTILQDIELGWTDRETGPYVDPAEGAEFMQELVRRWNAYAEDISRGIQPGPSALRAADALPEKWTATLGSGQHIKVPGIVKPIDAGSVTRASRIIASVNALAGFTVEEIESAAAVWVTHQEVSRG